jgi:hypothetical protein
MSAGIMRPESPLARAGFFLQFFDFQNNKFLPEYNSRAKLLGVDR